MFLLPPALAGRFFITNTTWDAPKAKHKTIKLLFKTKLEKIFRIQVKVKSLDLTPKAGTIKKKN